ncbi:unnamed protein product [Gadus morhua 'NCC']
MGNLNLNPTSSVYGVDNLRVSVRSTRPQSSHNLISVDTSAVATVYSTHEKGSWGGDICGQLAVNYRSGRLAAPSPQAAAVRRQSQTPSACLCLGRRQAVLRRRCWSLLPKSGAPGLSGDLGRLAALSPPAGRLT